MITTNSNPPVPLPVQLPPGHVVQQIVNECGTLQHVILGLSPHAMTVPVYPCVSIYLFILTVIIQPSSLVIILSVSGAGCHGKKKDQFRDTCIPLLTSRR